MTDITEQQAANTSSEPNQLMDNTPPEITETDCFFLRFSTRCRPFKLPEYPEVAQILQDHFIADEAVSVDYEYQHGEQVFIIELSKKFPAKQVVEFKVNKRTYRMRLEPQEPNGKNRYTRGRNTKNRQEGVLLTFYKAGRKSLQGKFPSTQSIILQCCDCICICNFIFI